MKFNCAIIGLGRIGCGFDDVPNKKSIDTHAGAYSNNSETNLVALSDIDDKKLKKYGKKYGISSLYTNFQDMFKNEQLDCVSICTLADSHLQIVKEAAKSNIKGIFLEKPISISLKDAIEIIKICDKNNIKLQIDHQRRFSPFYKKIREIINSEKFGNIQHCSIYYGSGIANTGSHIFDLINYFFGGIKWIEGIPSRNSSNNSNDPNIDGKFECKNGLICNLQSFDSNKYSLLEFDIIGTKARIKINLTDSKAEFFEISKKQGLAYKKLLKKQDIARKGKKTDIVLGLENLLGAIKNDINLLSTGTDGFSSLDSIITIRTSAEKKGKRMNLPINSYKFKISSK